MIDARSDSAPRTPAETAIETPGARTLDMKLDVVVIPVSDIDRVMRFYDGPRPRR